MMTNSLPHWTPEGVLPPFIGSATAVTRSPYEISLVDLVVRFATSRERCEILDGLLRFRAALHRLGFVRGFQWIDGSFTENVEQLEGRAPRDVDVVTFLNDPSSPSSAHTDDDAALDHARAKQKFAVDSYLVELDHLPPPDLIQQASYWYGVWSHRRTLTWKGFIQIPLEPDDQLAAAALTGAV